jgi:hypothetical protein
LRNEKFLEKMPKLRKFIPTWKKVEGKNFRVGKNLFQVKNFLELKNIWRKGN